MNIESNRVILAQRDPSAYEEFLGLAAPELPAGAVNTAAGGLLRALLKDAGLDSDRFGTAEWNPLGDLIQQGDKVLLKPNWVMDENRLRGGGMDCLVTHPSVLEAVLHYVVKAQPGEIVVGDAPLQNCDYENLRAKCGLDDMCARFKQLGYEIQVRDFRLTKMNGLFNDRVRTEPDPNNYCLFDLGEKSWLTPITGEKAEFRVANYDPDILSKHHHPGTHRYLIAREVIDADVVISLPKLKTHRKAGVTGALKNAVGINGFKEYLPHHRKGGSSAGGDCYQDSGWLKKFAEDSLDRANRSISPLPRYMNFRVAGLALRLDGAFLGGERNLDGGWYGNDTVWRMCLDLQRILHYGNGDGRICDTPQRKVITITDAIIAGDGDGPLAPSPVPLGIMTLGTNEAALEWVHCLLMRLDPQKIPLVAHAFEKTDWPLTDFTPDDIQVFVNGQTLPDLKSVDKFSRYFSPSAGWKGNCELSGSEEAQPVLQG